MAQLRRRLQLRFINQLSYQPAYILNKGFSDPAPTSLSSPQELPPAADMPSIFLFQEEQDYQHILDVILRKVSIEVLNPMSVIYSLCLLISVPRLKRKFFRRLRRAVTEVLVGKGYKCRVTVCLEIGMRIVRIGVLRPTAGNTTIQRSGREKV